jgi:hypothetical protein
MTTNPALQKIFKGKRKINATKKIQARINPLDEKISK